MPSVPFSMRMDTEIKARLESEAMRKDRSAGYIVQKAVERYLEHMDFFRKEIAAAVAEADKGVFISEEAMNKWMESWDTGNELPPPEPDIFPDK